MSLNPDEITPFLRPREEGILGDLQQMIDRLYAHGNVVRYNESFGGDKVLQVIHDMNSLFIRVGLFEGGMSKENYSHPNGIHISTRNAYNCFINDQTRSFAFMHAAILTVENALRNDPKRPVLFLEAGSGPAAPMALALATRFRPECVQVATIDWFADATNRVQRLFNTLQLQSSLEHTFTGDIGALTPEDIQPDIVGLEVANRLLLVERQAELAYYLQTTFPKAVIIPHRVELSAVALQEHDQSRVYGEPLGKFFDFKPPFALPADGHVRNEFTLPEGTKAISLDTSMVITPPGTSTCVRIFPGTTRWINESCRVPVDPGARRVRIAFPLGGSPKDIQVKTEQG